MAFMKELVMSSKKKKKKVVYIILMMGPNLPDVGAPSPETDKKGEENNKGEVG